MIRKIFLAVILIAVSAAYIVWEHVSSTQSIALAPETPNATTTTITEPPPSGTPTPTPAPTPTPTPTPKPKGQYADGTYTGVTSNTIYGPVQVKAIVQGGKIIDVQFLQHPNDRATSREISAQAMPFLTQEAIAAQSAQVSGVTGATQTSEGFVESLGSALVKAKA